MREPEKNQPEMLWVEVEVFEGDGLNAYSGCVESGIYEAILAGTIANRAAFLRLDHVFWVRSHDSEEWAQQKKEVREYGKGRMGNYKGSMHIRIDQIYVISELKGGADLQRKYCNL